jgi:hypothetical protein
VGRAIFLITLSRIPSVSSASTLRTVSTNRSNCGFSSFGRGLRDGMGYLHQWSIFSRPLIDFAAFLACPPLSSIQLRRPPEGIGGVSHARCAFATIKAGFGWLRPEGLFQRTYARLQGCDLARKNCATLGNSGNALPPTPNMRRYRPFPEGHYG